MSTSKRGQVGPLPSSNHSPDSADAAVETEEARAEEGAAKEADKLHKQAKKHFLREALYKEVQVRHLAHVECTT